ncbi:DnaT-like ssDNA-binding protein [Pseudomonas typographi]|uniref:Putative DnaT-like domain-containing protein n=1 Tax=Pseudomonas typographi TaxID=2715964 RepID=A0ABR7Z952_9PSED|nr:DnaT-like ssDNA-binding protein [Pseudomonas typographi]MBD1602086.1 hypothetical protein [Pseudomonas typographi]
MIIVEHGKCDFAANSYAEPRRLAFLGSYYRIPVPDTEPEQERYLLLAVDAMNRMRWRGFPVIGNQPMAWPRKGITMPNGEILGPTIPYGISHGQVMLAAELYAADHGIEPSEPTHYYDKGKAHPLVRSTEQFMTAPPLWVASRTQFADYLMMRGLSIAH